MFRSTLIFSLLAISICSASIEYFPSHLGPDDDAGLQLFQKLTKKEEQIYTEVLNKYKNLQDERDPKFLEQINQTSPSAFEKFAAFDKYMKKQVEKLGVEAKELIVTVFAIGREYRRWKLIRQKMNHFDVIESQQLILQQLDKLSNKSKQELNIHLSPISKFLEKSSRIFRENGMFDNNGVFDQYVKNITLEEKAAVKNFVNSMDNVNGSSYLEALLKHVPSLYIKNVDFVDEIKKQTESLESAAKDLVIDFYILNMFFYRNAMVGGIIKSREDYETIVHRFAKNFDTLSKKSQTDILDKFPFVGRTLGRSTTKQVLH